MRCKYLLIQLAKQKSRLAIQVSTAYRTGKAAQQAGGNRCFEQHRYLHRSELARVQATHGAFRGDTPNLLDVHQIGRVACHGIPVVAFHRITFFGDHRATQAVP